MTRRWTIVCACLLASQAACAGVGSTLIADHDEYSAYRRVRTSERLDERLSASHTYLQQHPEGQWAREVRPWFERAELRYWVRIKESPAGLATYLRTLPEGPHAREAEEGLKAHRERQSAARRELLDLKAATTEERLAALARAREETVSVFTEWLGRFLAIGTWGQRTSALDHETIFAWRIDPPQGSCAEDRCSKLVQRTYELPGGGEHAERQLVMDVVFRLEQGTLAETRIEGPGLFSRLFEAGAKASVAYDNAAARVDAIAYAIEVAGGAAEAKLPAARCSQPVVAPVVHRRSCDGWTLEVIAAESPADDDVVSVVGPAKP